MLKSRYLKKFIEDLCFSSHKMAFISGPRQCGKTTLAKQMLRQRQGGQYFNWDEKGFRLAWTKHPLSTIEVVEKNSKGTPIVILDEIHKAKSWKRNLKGVYDSLLNPLDIIVTGASLLATTAFWLFYVERSR